MANTTADGGHHATKTASGLFLGPGQGPQILMGQLPVILKVLPELVQEAFELHEQPIPAGTLIVPHSHQRQDQVSYVTGGTLGFLVGDQEFTAPPGSCILRPRGIVHAVWNPGPGEAQMLELSTPGTEMAAFLAGFNQLSQAGQATPAAVAELARPYGITYYLDQVPLLEERHQVTADGAWWPHQPRPSANPGRPGFGGSQ